MSYPDQFQMSKELRPNEGYHLSKSECGFLLAEMEGLVEKYKKEIADPSMSPTLRRMCEHHLEGLEFITKGIKEGFEKKE